MGANLFFLFGGLSLDAVYPEQSSELKMAYVLFEEYFSGRSISSYLISNMKQ